MRVKRERKREESNTSEQRFNKSSVNGKREGKEAVQEWKCAGDVNADRLTASRQKTLYTSVTFTVWSLCSDKLLMKPHLSAGSEEETCGGVCCIHWPGPLKEQSAQTWESSHHPLLPPDDVDLTSVGFFCVYSTHMIRKATVKAAEWRMRQNVSTSWR